jgi:putative phage-type endonuclease
MTNAPRRSTKDATMKAITVTQGSPEWAALRAQHNTASEAPAMMGASKYQTRDELLRQKATGIIPEVSRQQQALFDRGHATEAAARLILEEDTGEDFYPITAVSDDGNLLASVDGITMDDGTLFEHKLWNEKLAESVRTESLGPYYYWQLEQQLLVTGAEKVIFVCSDGMRENWVQMEYRAVPGRAEALQAGWAQFDADKAAYVPSAIVEMPKAAVTLALPALFIHAKGEITTSNMPEYGKALAARLESVRKIALVTDQDFSDAKEAAKLLRENIESARQAKDAMLSQTVTVGEAARMIDAWCENMRLTALQLEKDVAREDLAKKTAMIAATKAAYVGHIDALEKEIAPHRLARVTTPVFADAIKNKRSFASMQDGLNTMLANAKIAADGAAASIRRNLAHFEEHAKDHAALFADKAELMLQSLDFVALSITSRITKHQAAEAQKEEATRQRIRAEEQAKAEKAVRDKADAEQREAETQRQMEEMRGRSIQATQVAASIGAPVANVVSLIRAAPAAQPVPVTPPTLKLGEIGARLGFSLTGDFLKSIGFEPAACDKSALLFHESSFIEICDALDYHIVSVRAAHYNKQAA